jgi:hypothetical protein
MANWQQETVMAEDRERGQRKNLSQPFGMLSHSVSSDSEQAVYSYAGSNNRQLTIPHPFNSVTSWIRAIPEEGVQYLALFRSDESKPQPVITVTRNSLERNDQYRKGANVYRPLTPGEIEVSSTGLAQAYFPRRAKMELRSGMLNRWMDQDKLTSGDRSPIHQKQLLQYRSNVLGDEERLGIVSRPKKVNGKFSTWEMAYPKVEGDYVAEHYMSLKNPANQNPSVLFRIHKGHVLDEEGVQITQTKTQIPLRYLEEYFAKDESSTRSEIDEKGNWYIELASAASEGLEVNVPSGNFIKTIGGNEEVFIEKNVQLTVGKNANYQIDDNWKIRVNKDYYLTSETGNMNFIMSSATDAGQMIMSTKGHYLILDDTKDKENIYMMHVAGSQVNLDSKGSVKLVSKDGGLVFMDADTKSITATSGNGAYVTLKDIITICDASGKQLLQFNGKDTINISASANVNINAPSINIAGGSVNLGNLASLGVALAEPLALLFDSHIHASPTGPTSPPLPPNTAALMNVNPATSFASAFVKVRTNLAG